MCPRVYFVASYFVLSAFFVGCGSSPTNVAPTKAASHVDADKQEQSANLAKLSDDDRRLAEAQGYCAVSAEPLGSMGVPLKLVINDQPAFICCQGCQEKALSHPDETLAKVAELQAKVKSESVP